MRSKRVVVSGMDISVGRVLSRLPRKSCWDSGWLKTYLRRLTVIMIEDLGVLGRLLFDNCGCSLCRRSDRISETRAQTRAVMMVFLVITFPDEVDASTFDKLSSLFVSRVKRLEVTEGDRISVERGTQRMQPTPGEIAFGYRGMRAIYGTDRNHCTGLQNVHEVAPQLRKAGITPKPSLYHGIPRLLT